MSPMLPIFITRKQWCCLADASSGLLIAGTGDLLSMWTRTSDGAILHLEEIVRDLLSWGVLQEVSQGRWIANAHTRGATWLPLEPLRGAQDQAKLA